MKLKKQRGNLMNIKTLSFCLFGVIFFSQCIVAQPSKVSFPDGSRYKLAFHDEFNGNRLDLDKWMYRTDSKHWSTQLPENVSLSDGFLYLNVKKQKSLDKEYTGAGIISKKLYRYGYYESRLKIPPGEGWHTSFWLMGYDGKGTGASATALELDIFENDSKSKFGYHDNVHRWKGKHEDQGKWVVTPDLSADFHTLGCEYSATEVKYYFDGKLVRTTDLSKMPHSDLNIWLTTIATFIGDTKAVDETKLPSAAIFDYVRYYTPIE